MSTPPPDSALWHTSVKLQHSAQALLIEQFLLSGKKPTQPYRASRPRSIAAVDDANQTVCFLVVLASLGPDLVLTFHVPHGEIRSLVPNVSTLIPVIKIVATNSWSFQLYRIVVSLAASNPTAHIPISVLPTTHSLSCARLSCPIWRLRASPFSQMLKTPLSRPAGAQTPSTMACDVVLVWPPSHRQRLCHQSTVSRLPTRSRPRHAASAPSVPAAATAAAAAAALLLLLCNGCPSPLIFMIPPTPRINVSI